MLYSSIDESATPSQVDSLKVSKLMLNKAFIDNADIWSLDIER